MKNYNETMDNQISDIEQFLVSITETNEYRKIEYLVYSIRKYILDYLSDTRLNSFKMPAFLCQLKESIIKRFCECEISTDNMLNYMLSNDETGWIKYYVSAFMQTQQCTSDLFFLILTGYVLDYFRNNSVDIQRIIEGEHFAYTTNQYGLTSVTGVQFKLNSFIFDNKAYLYNCFIDISERNFLDKMPGFAKIITDEVHTGNILLRVDERLALPVDQEITYSSICYDKFRGPQFHFEDIRFEDRKTIIVHMNTKSGNKLLMVIKKDYDSNRKEAFMHIEIETLPYYTNISEEFPCITTFLHGMYYPKSNSFCHIDYSKNQYSFSDYKKKYSDASNDVPIDFYADKQLHYKIWCIENGEYTKEIWYKLMMVSISEEYRILLNEILV